VEPAGHRSAIEVNMNTGGVGDRITVLGTAVDEAGG